MSSAEGGHIATDASVVLEASVETVWKFLSDPTGSGLVGVIPGFVGLEKWDPELGTVGHRFTEFFLDPDTGEKIPCTWETLERSPGVWHVLAEKFGNANVTIDLRYSISSSPEGVRLRRRMEVSVPPAKVLTAGWYSRLGDQKVAEETTKKIAARILERLSC
ncbi:SRPBCC family protein [Amycolatopsis speibonae]|uniref:SRPBCC family protein n=1 Tax=Amycolatopsis speibonae TaxID=1450224 RepID=A0ABV7PF41_9PSEU